MTTQIKAGVIAANAITASELASSALSGGSFTGDVTFDTDTLVVDSANNLVGIGTSSPESKLAVKGISGNADLFSISDVAVPTSGVEYGTAMIKTNSTEYALNITSYNANGKGLRIYNNGGQNAFLISQAGGDRFVVDGSGNVGIGTDSPNQDGFDANATVLSIKSANNGEGVLELIGGGNNSGDQISVINFMSQAVGNPAGQITALRGSADDEASITFNTSGAERLRITSSGDAQFKGNIAFTKQDGMTISGYESLVMQINSQNNQSSRVFQVNNYTTPLFIVHQTGIIDARLPFKFHSTTSDPSVTDQGSVYWNSTDKKFRYYTGSGWVNLTTPDLTAIPGLDVWADVTEGISGGTIADLSGNGVEGTPYDATNHIGTLGNNTYYNCNSSGGSWITYDRNDFNNYAGDVTLFFVMTNRSSLSSEGSFITQNYQAGVGYHIIRHSGTSDDFNVYASNVNNLVLTSTNTAIPVNASYNEGVIIIFSIGTGTNWVIYKKENGSEGVDTFTSSTSATFNFNSNTNAIRIGNSQWAGEYLNAGIFAWGIIDHQITASERQIIYDYYARKGIAV